VTLLALAAAFLAGTAFERYRQGRRQRPLTLGETPRRWATTARDSIGVQATTVAACAVAAALGLLLLPSLSSFGPSEPPSDDVGAEPQIDRSSLPQVKVLPRPAGAWFTVSGARFRVLATENVATTGFQASNPGLRLVRIDVDGENVRRSRFNPNHLSYRLEDRRGNVYGPEASAGTGPPSLGETGFLRRDEIAHARLAFHVPRSARRLALVFEPGAAGRVQVRVALGSG
jgi:hypothetical protein